jgi:hypothetical protein
MAAFASQRLMALPIAFAFGLEQFFFGRGHAQLD